VGPSSHVHDFFPSTHGDTSLAHGRGRGGIPRFLPIAAATLHCHLPPLHAPTSTRPWPTEGVTAAPQAQGFRMRGQKWYSRPSVQRGFEEGQMPLYRHVMKLRGIAGGEPLQSKISQISLHFARSSSVERGNGVWWGDSTGSTMPTRGSSSWR
jgi:hypothetical protein